MIIHEKPTNNLLEIDFQSEWENAYKEGRIFSFAKMFVQGLEENSLVAGTVIPQNLADLIIAWTTDDKEHKLKIFQPHEKAIGELEEKIRQCNNYDDYYIALKDYFDTDSLSYLLGLDWVQNEEQAIMEIIEILLTDRSMVPLVSMTNDFDGNPPVAKFFYTHIVDTVCDRLRDMEGSHYDDFNILQEIGIQVCEEAGYDWELYEQTVLDMAHDELDELPRYVLPVMWDECGYDIKENALFDICEDYFSSDQIYYEDDIAKEIFRRVCAMAEQEVEEYENEKYRMMYEEDKAYLDYEN